MSRTQKLPLSIVFPCLNEARTLAGCIRRAREACVRAGIEMEIIVADNGSSDGSQQIARAEGARLVVVCRRGYGAAVHAGIAAAEGKWVGFCDSDGSYPEEFFPHMLELARKENADLLLANRLQARIEPGAMPFLNRYVGTPVLSGMIRLLFAVPVYDCNSGMRVLKREKYQTLGLRSPGMAYASEMLCLAARQGWKYAECPLPLFRKDGRNRPSHLRRWRDGWNHFLMIWRSSRR